MPRLAKPSPALRRQRLEMAPEALGWIVTIADHLEAVTMVDRDDEYAADAVYQGVRDLSRRAVALLALAEGRARGA